MSNASCRKARKKISSGVSVMTIGVTPVDLDAAVDQRARAIVVSDGDG